MQISHPSWTELLTAAVRLKQHRGVEDVEQAWLLGELIRYLEHPASGALAFSDMGPNWIEIRDHARSRTLNKNLEGLPDVLTRWDQLLSYGALKLGSEIGEDVVQHLPRAERDQKVRMQRLADEFTTTGQLEGVLRIPNTVSDLRVVADLRTQQLVLSVDVDAPTDRGAVARVTWLTKQLAKAPPELVVEAYAKRAKQCTFASLEAVREDRSSVLGEDAKEPHRFRLVLRLPVGQGRRTGKKNPGFIASVLLGVDRFYGQVVQHLTEWRPPAPKLKRPTPLATSEGGRETADTVAERPAQVPVGDLRSSGREAQARTKRIALPARCRDCGRGDLGGQTHVVADGVGYAGQVEGGGQ